MSKIHKKRVQVIYVCRPTIYIYSIIKFNLKSLLSIMWFAVLHHNAMGGYYKSEFNFVCKVTHCPTLYLA